MKPDSGNDNRAGNCTDCGEPVWWTNEQHSQNLVTRDGNRWCFGPSRSRIGMERYHVLPGMAQYITPSPLGEVCHCLSRGVPHIHQIIDLPVAGKRP